MRLLIALVHPNDEQVKHVLERVPYIENVDRQRGIFQAHVDPPFMVAPLREWLRFSRSADYRILTASAKPAETLCGLHAEFSSVPGPTWYDDIEVSRCTDGWAIVLHYPDAEELPLHACPRVLGFARMETLHRGVGAVLAAYENSEYEEPPGASLASFGCSDVHAGLLKVCWRRHPEIPNGFSYGEHLLTLSDADVAYLHATYKDLDSEEVIEELQRLEQLCELWGSDLGAAVAAYGPLDSPRFQAWRAMIEALKSRGEE